MKEKYYFACGKKLNSWEDNMFEYYCNDCFKQKILLDKENIYSIRKLNKKKSLMRGMI